MGIHTRQLFGFERDASSRLGCTRVSRDLETHSLLLFDML